MPTTISDKKFRVWGVEILDEDGQPFPTVFDLPPNTSVTFSSSDETIAPLTLLPDGFHVEVHSGKVGTATVTATPVGLPDTFQPISDEVNIRNSGPGTMVGTWSDEQDETASAVAPTAALRAAATMAVKSKIAARGPEVTPAQRRALKEQADQAAAARHRQDSGRG